MARASGYLRLRERVGAVPIGGRPPNKSLAWWYLSTAAKRDLAYRRKMGFFGGRPGQAPYWAVQEFGDPKAAVKALHYIQRSVDEWRTTIHGEVVEWMST